MSHLVIVLRSQQLKGQQIFRPIHTVIADGPPAVALTKSLADLGSTESGAGWREWEGVIESDFALAEDLVGSDREAAQGASV